MLIAGLLSVACSVCFYILPTTTCPRMTSSDLILSYQSLIKKIPYKVVNRPITFSIKIVSFQIYLGLFHVDHNQTSQFVWGKENSLEGGGIHGHSPRFSSQECIACPTHRRRKKLVISLCFYFSRSLAKKWHAYETGEEYSQFHSDPGTSQKSDIEGGTEPLFASCFHLESKIDNDNDNYPSILALLNELLTIETLGKYFDTKLVGLKGKVISLSDSNLKHNSSANPQHPRIPI